MKSDHFYTINQNEIGTTQPGKVGKHGYTSEGTQCRIYSTLVTGSVPLYRYYNGQAHDHFYTTNANEIGAITPGLKGHHGYSSEGIAGYCFPSPWFGTVPLYRYYLTKGSPDHFYTTNPHEIGTIVPGAIGKYGYKSEGIACYVFP